MLGCDQAAPAGQRPAAAAAAASLPSVPPSPALAEASQPTASLLSEPQPTPLPEFPAIVGQDKLDPVPGPELLERQKGAVTLLEYWPNADGFVSASADGRLSIWKHPSNTPLHSLELPAGEQVVSLAISADSRQLLYTTGKRWMAIVDFETGQEARRIECPESDITSLAWSSDPRLAASGHAGAVRFWDLESGEEVGKSDLGGQAGTVQAMAFSPNCRELVVASGAWGCQVVTVRSQPYVSGSVAGSREGDRPGGRDIARITVSPSGRLVATVGNDGSVSVARLPGSSTEDPRVGPQIPDQIVEFRPGPGITAAFLPGEVYLCCICGLDINYRHLGAQQYAGRSQGGATEPVRSAISPNGKQMVVGATDGHILRLNLFNPVRCAEEFRVQNVRAVLHIFDKQDYDQLEEVAKNFRTVQGTGPSGEPLLQFFYNILATPRENADGKPDFDAQRAALERWLEAKPDSAAARIALAGMYIQYAWDARGSGFAYSVTEEGWKNFSSRIEMAQRLLEEAIKLEPKECAAYYHLITVGKSLGWPRAKVQDFVDKSLAADPKYYSTYREMADYLRPQWQGEPGDIAQFAAQLAERLPGPQGDEAYGNVALVAANCQPIADMYAQGFSRKRLLAAAKLFMKHYPDGAERMAFASRIACLAGDRKLAAEAFRHLHGATGEQRVFWPDARLLYAYKRWAFEVPPWPDAQQAPGQLIAFDAHIEPVRSLAFSPDGKTLATASGDPREEVKTWNVADGKLLRTFRHDSPIAAVAFSANGKRLAAAGGGATAPEVRVWSLASQKRPAKLTTQLMGALTTGFSHDDDWFATGGADGLVVLVQRSQKNKKQVINHEAIVRSLAFAPHSNLLTTGAEDGELRVFDLNTLSLKKTLPVGGAINSVGFAGDGKYAVATADNHRVAVCDIEKAEAKLHEAPQGDGNLPAHIREQMRGQYGPLACSQNSTRFVLAHIDRTMDRRGFGNSYVVEVWDAVDGGRLLGSFSAGGQIATLALSPDGKTLATSNDVSGRVRLWDLETAVPEIAKPAVTAASAP